MLGCDARRKGRHSTIATDYVSGSQRGVRHDERDSLSVRTQQHGRESQEAYFVGLFERIYLRACSQGAWHDSAVFIEHEAIAIA